MDTTSDIYTTMTSPVAPLDVSPIDLPLPILAVARVAKDTMNLEGRVSYVVDIDRNLAEVLLGHLDPHQRPRSKQLVAEIQADIENGKWFNTGDPIRLLPSGHLVDGQHRLSAFLRAKVPSDTVLKDVTVVVMKNRLALDVVDTGKSRTVNDLRKMTGRRQVSAKVIGAILYEMADFNARAPQSKIQRNDCVDGHPFLDQVVALAQPRKGIVISSTPVLAAAIRCMRVPGAKDQAFAFFNAALQNRYTVDGQIIPQLQLLTDWLISHHHNGGGHAIRRETVVRCLRAWNSYREARPIQRLRYSKRDEVPVAV